MYFQKISRISPNYQWEGFPDEVAPLVSHLYSYCPQVVIKAVHELRGEGQEGKRWKAKRMIQVQSCRNLQRNSHPKEQACMDTFDLHCLPQSQ